MNPTRIQSKSIFLALVAVQVAHSLEEYAFHLYDELALTRFVSRLVSEDPATGFAILNTVIVCIGVWCYWVPVRREYSSALYVMWLWVIVEFANGIAHLLLAVAHAGYFPGAITAIPLLVLSVILGRQLIQPQTRARDAA